MSDMEQPELQTPPWRKTFPVVFIVLPAYNEEKSLPELFEQIDQSLTNNNIRYRVIIVDDGSKDRTAAITGDYARYMPITLHSHPLNLGLGATIRDGLQIAAETCRDQDIIIAMDADNTHPPGLIASMLRCIDAGNDVVIASRYQQGSSVRGVPWHRLLFSIGARFLFQAAFPIHGVRDYTCGYRAYKATILKAALKRYGDHFVSEQGFQCMVDILLKLHKMGAIMCEVPLILRYDLKGGVSKMKVTQTIIKTLLLMIKRRLGFGI